MRSPRGADIALVLAILIALTIIGAKWVGG